MQCADNKTLEYSMYTEEKLKSDEDINSKYNGNRMDQWAHSLKLIMTILMHLIFIITYTYEINVCSNIK
jgi:hypothetical protein